MSDPVAFQRHIAAVLLGALEGTDFALAGSGAIREHGITERPTQDVDLFATAATSPEQFVAAVARAEQVLGEAGHAVTRIRSAPLFARLLVESSAGDTVEVDLAVDWRKEPPVQLSVGHVLALGDAVGNKVGVVYSRGEVRDFLDLDSIRQARRFTDDELLQLARDHDPGFDVPMFARQLSRATRLSLELTEQYGVGPEALAAIQRRLLAWASHLADQGDSEEPGPSTPPPRPRRDAAQRSVVEPIEPPKPPDRGSGPLGL